MSYMPKDGVPYLQHTDFNASPAHRNRLAAVIRLLEQSARPGSCRVLEIGCGVGNIALPIASLGYDVTGIDLDPESIEIAARRNPFPNLRFERRSLEEADVRPFDAVILTEVLEHVPRCEEKLKSLARSMRPETRLILTVPNGWGIAELACRPSYWLKRSAAGVRLVGAVKRLVGARELTTANLGTPHVHFFTLGRLERLFAGCGLRVAVFHSFSFVAALAETILSERRLPEKFAARDFELSQRLPPWLCALWAFLLERER